MSERPAFDWFCLTAFVVFAVFAILSQIGIANVDAAFRTQAALFSAVAVVTIIRFGKRRPKP